MKEAGPTMKPESYIQGPEGERRGTPPSKQIRPFRLSGNGGKNNFSERPASGQGGQSSGFVASD